MTSLSQAGRTSGRRHDRATTDLVPVLMAVVAILGAIVAGIAAADTLILAVAAAAALLLATAIVLRPDVATLTTVAILYSNAAVVAVRFHGVPLFLAALVPMLLVVPLARDLIVRRLPVVAPPMLPWMVVLLAIHAVSALFSSDTNTSWDAVVVFAVEGFGLYFLLLNVIRTPAMLRQVTWVLVSVGAFVSALSVHQALTSNYDSVYLGFAQASDAAFRTGESTLTGDVLQPRLAGSIGETNRFAQVMLMLVPLGAFRFIDERSHALRIVAAVMTALITLGVVLTFSRGAAVGLGVLIVALVVLRLVQARHALTVAALLIVVIAIFPQYWTRVSSLGSIGGSASEVDTSLLSRATETLAAALVMVDHPVIGVGPDMFPIYYERYAEVVGILVKNDAEREAHNLILGVGAELGFIGLAAFLWIALLTARMILAARRASIVRRPDLERLTTPFLLALLTYHVTGLFLHLSFARFYWLILGVAGAAAIITLRESAAAPGPADGRGRTSNGRAPRMGAGTGSAQEPYSQSV